MSADASGIDNITPDSGIEKLTDVYDIHGRLVKRNVKLSDARAGLAPGIYIADGRKIAIMP